MISFRWRLLVHFAVVVLLCLAIAWISAFWTTRSNLSAYVLQQHKQRATALSQVLSVYYEDHGSFDGAEDLLSSYLGLRLRRGMGAGRPQGVPENSSVSGERIILFDSQGRILWDSSSSSEPVSDALRETAVSIISQGQKVGEVLVTSQAASALGLMEEDFLSKVKRGLTVSGLMSFCVAVLLALQMSKRVTDPLEKMVAAAREVSSGKFGKKVEIDEEKYPREIRGLVEAFNSMSQELEKSEDRKREMLRDISHEIRTPLTILSGNLEALSEGVIKLDDETLATMMEEVKRLSDLSSGIQELDDARAHRRFKMTVLDPGAIVERAFLATQGAAGKKGISLRRKVEEGLPPVIGDSDKVQEVLSNLLSNALRYTPAGGTLTIEAGRLPAKRGSESGVVFGVRDSGPGISDEDLPRIFERFFRGDPSRSRSTGGSGLGLAIAKEIVEGMGGSIWVERPPDGGALFCFTLPLARENEVMGTTL